MRVQRTQRQWQAFGSGDADAGIFVQTTDVLGRVVRPHLGASFSAQVRLSSSTFA